jgi:polysaccharide export outer membrane protein
MVVGRRASRLAFRLRGRGIGLLGVACLGVAMVAACAGAPATCAPSVAKAADVSGYRLGPGDEVQVTVFGQEDLSGRFKLDGEGGLALPLVGEIAANRLTTREVEQGIADRLRAGNYLVSPQVGIQVMTYRPFYILGEVQKPGQYPYRNGMTVVNAVALAGGYTYRARTSKVTIRRGDCTLVAQPDSVVLPDEIITVPERFI